MTDDTSSAKPEAGPGSRFRDAMADVKPLRRRRVHHGRRPMPEADSRAKRDAAESFSNNEDGSQWPAAVVVDAVDAGAVLAWKSAGVQERVFQRLKAGQFEIRRKLDLHGMTVREAGQAVFELVEGTRTDRQCCLLVIHGRGDLSSKPPRLKSSVYAWLKDHPRVVALHSAARRHGGTGATYALLKRSH
ncbi:MAG: Smr/MutS family protein [Rhodospirillaceae bacterium]|nr:Smr/MutS family protein [Rhodospirillaceae bacterium]